MHVAITGATGNTGTALVRALASDARVSRITGVARRVPEDWQPPKTHWRAADVTESDLRRVFAGADCVVHLAWQVQPSHDEDQLWAVNVMGTVRVLQGAVAAGVRSVVVASSVGAYAPGPKVECGVDESWPTHGMPTSRYAREKAYVERLLDAFELEHPEVRVVRMRPALIFQRGAASSQRRLFLGSLVPRWAFRGGRLPMVPDVEGLALQGVHADDVAAAYQLAVTSEVRGALNVAADPVMTPEVLARYFHARRVKMSRRMLRAVVGFTWRLRLQPADPGWVDVALDAPVLDCTRLRELGWTPKRSALEALREVLEGMYAGDGMQTPHLLPARASKSAAPEGVPSGAA